MRNVTELSKLMIETADTARLMAVGTSALRRLILDMLPGDILQGVIRYRAEATVPTTVGCPRLLHAPMAGQAPPNLGDATAVRPQPGL